MKNILAYKLKCKNDTNKGFVAPVAEIIGKKMLKLDANNFEGYENNVVIFDNYEQIDNDFGTDDLFKIEIKLIDKKDNQKELERESSYCGYGNSGYYKNLVQKISSKELVEVFENNLPSTQERIVYSNRLPNTVYVMLLDNKNYFGPFEWEEIPDEKQCFKIKPMSTNINFPGKNLLIGQIIKVEMEKLKENLIYFNINKIERGYLQNLILTGFNPYEYSSDEEILSYCLSFGKFGNKNLSVLDLETILSKNKNTKDLKNRWLKFEDIIGRLKNSNDDYINNFQEYFKTLDGKEIVKKHIENHESFYLVQLKQQKKKEIDSSINKENEQLIKFKEDIKEKSIELKEIIHNIEKKQEELKIKDELKIKKFLEDQNNAIKEKKTELESLNNQFIDLKKKYSEFENLDKREKQINYLEIREKNLNQKIQSLELQIEEQKKQLKESNESLGKKLMEMKPFVDTINGSFYSPVEKKVDLNVKCLDSRSGSSKELIEDQEKIISSIKNYLISKNRFIEDWEISNLLIITQQSFLTILAGLPGTGKTSLARLLSNSQKLEKRFCDISVARGWTSSKEIIGMYNPIHSRFQPSNTGLYSFLKSLSQEKNSEKNPMSYVLLDEANLSPIEHYWSSFIGMTDDNHEKILKISESEEIEVSKSLRFLATVNYDETTELISQRILDRTAIIVLDANLDLNLDLSLEYDIKTDHEMPYSLEIMEILFGRTKEIPLLDDFENNIIEKILKISKDGSFIPISHRKLNNIKQYCNKAKPMMNKFKPSLAIDLAILQYVLPLINGQGENFAKKLKELKFELSNYELEKSEAYLDKIISLGEENFNSYSFFYW